MSEQQEHAHGHEHESAAVTPHGWVLLDIGQDTGALVVYTASDLDGAEIEVSPIREPDAPRVHTEVHERRVRGQPVWAGVFPALRHGTYTLWGIRSRPTRIVSVRAGAVAEIDWH